MTHRFRSPVARSTSAAREGHAAPALGGSHNEPQALHPALLPGGVPGMRAKDGESLAQQLRAAQDEEASLLKYLRRSQDHKGLQLLRKVRRSIEELRKRLFAEGQG